MIIVKTAAELDAMRVSGRMAARVRDAVARSIRPGVTTRELGDYAAEVMRELGAESAFLGYRGFPGTICVSVNETVVHGIPNDQRIELGDIVSLDIGVKYGGYIGDTATTVMVGVTDPEVLQLVRETERALAAGIAQAVTGKRLSDISHAVEQVAREGGYSVVREFVGHGIGARLHEEPQIPNFGRPGRGPWLKGGMTLAIEPMINAGQPGVKILEDGWTAVTQDGRLSAHFEHTVAITDNGPEILTKL